MNQEYQEYISNLRRYFHAHPEPSLQEYETCKKIESELDTLQIPHTRIGETGVYAWIDGTKNEPNKQKKIVALRADIDALNMQDLKQVPYRSQNESVCHACGHDAHAATLLGAAKALKQKQSEFSGQVRLFFQQAEEIGQGARLFVKAGLMNGVSRVFGAHVSSRLPVGTVALTKGPQNASCDYFKITIKGKGAHVSTPHMGIDALYIASQIVIALQSIVSRNTAPLDTVVVGVGVLRAGTQYNIVAEHAEIEGTTRAFTKQTREYVNAKVVQIAKQTAALYGAEAEVLFEDYAAPLVNDAQAVEEVTAVAEQFIDRKQIISDFEKALGADDFADYLAETKGMYAFIGTQNPNNPNTAVAHHHGLFDIDETALFVSCELYVRYALFVLQS